LEGWVWSENGSRSCVCVCDSTLSLASPDFSYAIYSKGVK
jgi:hypothetical protein